MTAQQAQDLARIIDELQAAAESKGDETPPNSSDRFRLLREIGQINRPRTPPRTCPMPLTRRHHDARQLAAG